MIFFRLLTCASGLRKVKDSLKNDLTREKESANIPPMNILIKLDEEPGRLLEERAKLEKRTKTAMARILLLKALEKEDTEK
jgi:hypothetical protein